MAQSLELAIIALLRDEYLQSIFFPHMDPSLIVEDVPRTMFEALREAGTSELSAISVEVKKRVIDDDIYNDIMLHLDRVKVPIQSHTAIEKCISQLEAYVRWRKTANQVNYMSALDLGSVLPMADNRKSYDRLVEACTFSVSALDDQATFRFNLDEDYERAKKLAFPGGKAVRSVFSLLNESFQHRGYIPGTLTAVVAPTGVGKSTFLVDESVGFIKDGMKVLHYVLGDLNGYDMCHKYMANYLGVSLDVLTFKSDDYYKTDKVHHFFKNVVHRINDSKEVTADDIYNDAMRRRDEFEYGVIIVDYDGNIKSSQDDMRRSNNDDNNMYKEGGRVYSTLERLARKTNSVLLVGCQPKPEYWNKEILPLESPNESSRKQHAIDALVTMSRPNPKIPVGTMSLPKVRRGVSGNHMNICYLNEYATIIEVTSKEKETIKGFYEKDEEPAVKLKSWVSENRNFRMSESLFDN